MPISEADLKGRPGPDKICGWIENLISRIYGGSVKPEIFEIHERINGLINEALDEPSDSGA
jgi:hypothetical protein